MSNVVRLAGRGQPRTVLLVEPHAPSRIETASYLRSRDYCVVEAVTAEEAVRLLRSGRIAHVLLSSAHLHETADGRHLAAAVAQGFPHVRLLQATPAKHGPDMPRLERAIRAALPDRTPHN
jgi:hypothetical protein